MAKNIMALFMTVVIALYPALSVFAAGAGPGDVDLNGVIEVKDAVFVLQYILDKNSIELTEEEILNADVKNYGDGEITAADAALILKKALDDTFVFPAGGKETTEDTTETSTDAESLLSTESITESETESITESETESETESITESETENETESITENKTESETESITESETESETESTSENTSEDDAEETTQNAVVDEKNAERFEKIEEMISQLMVNNVDKNGNVTYTDISWNIEKSGRNVWHYASGAMIKAFLDIYERTQDSVYYDYAKKHMDFFISNSGEITHYTSENSIYTGTRYILDDINPGKPLFYFYEKTGDSKYKTAIDTLQSQLVNQPRTSYNVKGNFWHKESYPQQIWLDGLYMAQPFYMEYGNKFNNSEVCEDSYNQFINVYNNMKDPVTGLYYHGYDDAYTRSDKQSWSDSETGLSKSFWLRAMGWYAMSLVDTIEKMPESMTEEKQNLISIYKEYVDALIKYQDPDTGMWYQVVDQGGRDGNYLETSGTLAISYSIMKAVRLGFIDESYFEYGERAFDGVCDNYVNDKNGTMTLSNLCLVAGLDAVRNGTYEYYISTTMAENDAKGLAPLLFAYNEVRYKYDK